jgi:hypothetical protein
VPLVSYPGIGAELQLLNLSVGPVPGAGLGTPLMTTTFGRQFNNLSVPGATVGAVITLTGAEPPQQGEPTAVTFSRFILRGIGTQVQQAVALDPTFVAIWIGGNDYLGAALSGTPALLTPTADFRVRYEAMLDQLIAGVDPDTGIIVGNLPAVVPPILTLVPPFIINPATGLPVPGPDGNPIYYIADLGGGNFGQLPPGSLVLLDARAQIATGFGIPGALAPIPPFNQMPNVGQPLADRYVLTPTEMQTIISRVAEYNSAIQQAATARQIPVADIAGLFNEIVAGKTIGPISLNASFISGGFFSYDGFHLTDLGYLLFANEYIRTINASWDTEIPLAGITQLYANNGAFFPEVSANSVVFAEGVAEQIRMSWASRPVRNFRATAHDVAPAAPVVNRDVELSSDH